MTLKFYDFPMAPSPRRARILLAEKNVPHEAIIVDMMKAEQLGDEYRAINPLCTIPALKLENGIVLTENAGIAAYLDEQYPDVPMLGSSSIDKGLIANWNAICEFQGLAAVAEALRNSSPGMKDRAITGPVNWPQIPELAERGLGRIDLFFDILNERLEGREYLATDEFSYADITAVVVVDFARVVKKKPQDRHENLNRWRSNIHSRPSMSL